MPQAPPLTVDSPVTVLANVVYTLPSYPVLLAYQSVPGATLQTSVDGVNFSNTDASAANEARSIQLAQVFIRFTANTTVVAKKAFMAVYQPPVGGGAGSGGAAVFSRGLFGDGTAPAPSISFQADPDTGFYRPGGGGVMYSSNGAPSWLFFGGDLVGVSTGRIGFTNGDPWLGTVDVALLRDGPNALAQRNGLLAQQFSLYNSYTNASNYRRLSFYGNMSSNRPGIQAEGLGTGAGSLELCLGVAGGGPVTLFSPLQWNNDNAQDIGTLGAARPRNIYAAGNVNCNAVNAGAAVSSAQTVAVPAGGSGAVGVYVSAGNIGIFVGSGPPTLSAQKGSLYLRTDGTTGATRAYVNTDGGTTWTNLTAAA